MGMIRVVMGKVEKIREWEESNAGGCNNTASFLGGRCGAGWEVTVIGVMLVGGSNNAHQRIVRLMAGGGGRVMMCWWGQESCWVGAERRWR